jgi:hypothetical protein
MCTIQNRVCGSLKFGALNKPSNNKVNSPDILQGPLEKKGLVFGKNYE